MTVTVEEAQNSLPELLDRAASGEDVVITREGLPAARLISSLTNVRQQALGDAPEVSAPRRVRVVGMLVDFAPGHSTFALTLANGKDLFCQYVGDRDIDAEKLENSSVLIDGTAFFNTNREIYVIKTEHVRPATEADSFYNRMPKAFDFPCNMQEVGRANAQAMREMFGKWPGNETDEQIEAALREIS